MINEHLPAICDLRDKIDTLIGKMLETIQGNDRRFREIRDELLDLLDELDRIYNQEIMGIDDDNRS